MIQLYSLMWILGVFFAVLGFLRGWNRDLVATAGILLGMFALFQFDFFIRGVLLALFTRNQAFLIQSSVFLILVFYAYQSRSVPVDERGGNENLQSGLLGALVGFFNGYLVGGTLWYFLDINEYPFAPFIVAPGPNSPSAQAINAMPLVLLSGGASGSGEFIAIAVVVLLLILLLVL